MPQTNNQYLRLEIDQPVEVSLKNLNGRHTKGFQGPEVGYALTDGRLFYVPVQTAERIAQLQIQPGEKFTVVKLRKGREVEWIVSRSEGSPAATLLNRAEALDSPLPPEPIRRPSTALEEALKTAISAACAAEKHAEQLKYSCRFTSADIKSMAISVLIGMQQDRRAA